MIELGRDTYGPQKSGLLLSALDRMTLAPKDFVVVEKASTLYAADGKTKVTAW